MYGKVSITNLCNQYLTRIIHINEICALKISLYSNYQHMIADRLTLETIINLKIYLPLRSKL